MSVPTHSLWSVVSLGSYRITKTGTLGRWPPVPLPWKGVQVLPPSVVLKMCPTDSGMSTAGSHDGETGFAAQPTALESTALLDTSHVSFESVPPRLLAFCGAAKSLPLPIQMVPVPFPVTFGMLTPCGLTKVVAPTPGLSTTRNEPSPVVLVSV